MNELHKTIKEIEDTLQEARGDLSRYEHKFATDSPEQQLIVELLERLDEASDPETIEENVRDYSDDLEVTEEKVSASEVVEGDIVLDFGNPCEVVRVDGWWKVVEDSKLGYDPTVGHDEVELTLRPWQGEDFTTVHNAKREFRVALRDA